MTFIKKINKLVTTFSYFINKSRESDDTYGFTKEFSQLPVRKFTEATIPYSKVDNANYDLSLLQKPTEYLAYYYREMTDNNQSTKLLVIGFAREVSPDNFESSIIGNLQIDTY